MKNVAFYLCLAAAVLLSVIPSAASAAPGPRDKPSASLLPSTISDRQWAGWVAISTKDHFFTEVESYWKVPTATEISLSTSSAVDWVGIDGCCGIDDHIIQVGTGVTYTLGKGAEYFGWYEKANSVKSSQYGNFNELHDLMIVHPGNLMEAGVEETSPGSNRWGLYLENLSTGQKWDMVVDFTTPGLTAEAIHENPGHGSEPGQFEKTTNVEFVSTTFNHIGIGLIPDLPHIFPNVTLHQIDMDLSSLLYGFFSATPSALAGDCFTVADGHAAPPPPPSCEA